MTKNLFTPASLKARTFLFVLGILLFSLWALAFFAGQHLYGDMRTLLNDQQFSTAKVIASEIELELNERLSALDRVSETVTQEMLANPVELQTHMARQLILQNSFTGGAFITGADGVVIASFPFADLVGVSLIDRDYIQATLSNDAPAIGRPVLSKKLGFPALVMAVPIHDSSGHVIGVIGGATNLSQSNFLDHVTLHAYGKTGGYMLVSAKHRVIVTASDKRRILEALPGLGSNPVVDRFLNGYEGSLVMADQPDGEVLVSAKAIPMADWHLLATLPTAEAFGPIAKLRQHVLLITLLLTILACFITWWLLRALLTPMLTTVSQLADMANERLPLQPLPVGGPTEIAQLIGGFNRLILKLKRRERELVQSTAFGQAILNSIPAEIVVLSRTGIIIDMNRPWRQCATDAPQCSACRPGELGRNYLNLDPNASVGVNGEPLDLLRGIKAVLGASLSTFTAEYPCLLADRTAWYSMTATPLASENGGVVISHTDITERKRAQLALETTLLEKDALFKEVHHRVKNNLQVINSLLRLESGRSANSDTRAVLDEMRGRIRSMAILHESLYRSKSLAAIDLGSYLGELAAQACSSMADRTRNINLQMDLATIPVGMDLALPCGLLVNELISNSFKHAFPDKDGGSIRMELAAVDSGTRARLRISDTGVGLPSDFKIEQSESLGLHLVSDLAAQINGQLEVGAGPGACFTVTFPIENLLLG